MTYIIVGGSSGLGRALAERFAAGGNELVLLSRDIRDTEAVAKHLTLLYAVKVSPVAMDLNSKPLPTHIIDNVLSRHSPLQGLLLPAGINHEQDSVGSVSNHLEFLLRVNYLAPCQLVEHYLSQLESHSGVIIGFGSIATARGRSRNAAYAAAKSALESYFESLAHKSANSELHCQYYILGYLDTNLAFAQDLKFPLASPKRVAEIVYKRRFSNGRRFLPRPWYFAYHALRILPWSIFKRLSF